METRRASRIGMDSCATSDARRPWSADLMGFRTTTFGSTCSINRYYDPTTDQFLSIDPYVQTTDQPYVFTNDDPLNAEDPLGLAGNQCDSTNAKKQQACVAAQKAAQKAADKVCPSGYYNNAGKCDPALATQQSCSFSNCAPTWPMDAIEIAGGAIACIPGAVACALGGLSITAVKVGGDIQNKCSTGNTFVDAFVGILGSIFGGVFRLGSSAAEGFSAAERGIFSGTTNAAAAAQSVANACQ